MNRKLRTAVLSAALAGVLTAGGIAAYFTDADTATNTFTTVGKISLDLTEPQWDEADETGIHDKILPGQEFVKDPQITNDGNNEEYVFLEVIVPYAEVATVKADGTPVEKAKTQLFDYTVNDDWTLVVDRTENEADQTYSYVYAYTGGDSETMKALQVNATTETLFDAVRFANVIEGQLEDETENIVLNAYGIQTTALDNGDTDIDGQVEAGKTAPLDVWKILSAQAELNS